MFGFAQLLGYFAHSCRAWNAVFAQLGGPAIPGGLAENSG
jgi:hypothetical protein